MASLERGFHPEPVPQSTIVPAEGATVIITTGPGDEDSTIDQASGAELIPNDDGGVDVNLEPSNQNEPRQGGHSANLATLISPGERDRISSVLLEAIQADELTMRDWLDNRSEGIDLLGFKLEKPRSDSGTGPVPGMSTVRNPALAEAVVRFQSNASAELFPAEGPVKVRDDTPPPPESAAMDQRRQQPMGAPAGTPMPATSADLAEALEKGMNYHLTVTDKGYRPDSVRMLFWVGYGGCGFKKVYNDPLRRMPLSRSVDAADIIISNFANDIDDAGRLTHRIMMRQSTLRRMQIAGVYRDIELGSMPVETFTSYDEKKAEVQGFQVRNKRPEDQDHTIYECYCELDIQGFEHKDEDGKVTGLNLPYRVTIEKDSREVLEIRRNWKEEDPNCIAKRVFVKYPFIPAFGFHDIGLLHLLGNSTRALTAAWRESLDAGMYASFPGFLYSDLVSRQDSNEFRIAPGSGARIKTGGRPIGDVVMPLPYKDPSTGLMMLTKEIQENAQRLGGTAELQVAEGRQDAPVGTTLAMIEQATKMLAAVHINLHAAQMEEFQLLRDCFREDPEAFWRFDTRASRKQWEIDEFLAALNACDLVPAADPNTPSRMHRIMKAMAIKQLQAASPTLYDATAVDAYVLRIVGVSDPYTLFASVAAQAAAAQQPQGPPPDPAKMAEIQLKGQQQQNENSARLAEMQSEQKDRDQNMALKQQQTNTESADRAADRLSRERESQMREETQRLKMAGEAAQAGLIPPNVALAAATGQPLQPPAPGLGGPSPAFAAGGRVGLAEGGIVPDPIDFTDKYNTPLAPDAEHKFQAWAKANPRLGNTYDYDARGFWASGGAEAPNGHATDQFKKPNHPSFSNQSQYNGTDGFVGGNWAKGPDEKWRFNPGPANVAMHGVGGLSDYFKKSDPDVQLVVPTAEGP